MSVEALPGNTHTPPELMPSDTRWLSGVELVTHEERAALRSWLLTPGLLTQRIRAAAGTDFSMSVLREQTTASGHEREIDMRCAGVVWLFAHTSIPAPTLSAQSLWVRRSVITVTGFAFSLYEVFLPAIGERPSSIPTPDFHGTQPP